MSIQPGRKLGPYEIVASIGVGGMGEVWRARDTRLDREVAVKVLPAGFASSPQFLERFEREARAISALNHPNICTLYDVGEAELGAEEATSGDSGVRYLVMELMEGESLAERLKRGPLPLHEVLKVGRQIASALDAAHRRGIVHRDLKPGNVMLTKSGAKLLDFGLAKAVSEEPAPLAGLTSLPTEEEPLTREGTILGTFQYMAPEQLEGTEADARSDIFALGAVLYEMATGRRAFAGESKASLIAAIVSSQPEPVSSVTPMSPPALDHAVRRCLEKDPDDRWQSAHDIAGELEWISQAGSQAGVVAPLSMRRKSRERLAWGLATALLLALIAVAVAWMGGERNPSKLVVAAIPPPRGAALIPFDELGLALSPDGTRLAFVAYEGGGRKRIWLRDLGSPDAKPVPGTEGAWYPFWSPDGRHLGYFAQGKLQRVDLRGGSPQILADAPSGRGGSWSADDLILYSPNIWTSLWSVPAGGGVPTEVTAYDAEKEWTHRWPVFLPDGDLFVYVSRRRGEGGQALGRLMLASIRGGEPRVLIDDATNALYVPGFLVYGKETSLFAQPFDPDSLELTGRAVPIVDRDVSYWEPKNLAVFAASPDGTLVYLPDSPRRSILQWYGRDGHPMGAVNEPDFQRDAALSPDATKIAFVRRESPNGSGDLWIHDLQYGSSSRITFSGEVSGGPVWSQDGSRVAFSCVLSGLSDLCVKALDRPGEVERLSSTPMWSQPGSWSPDGKRFYFSDQDVETNQDLYVLDLDEAEEPRLIFRTPFREVSPMVSPDGQWLAYVSDETGAEQIFLRSASGATGQWQVSKDGGSVPRWSKRGREILYLGADGSLMAAEIESLSPVRIAEPRVLFQLPGEPYRDEPVFQDVTPDGERILLNVSTESRSAVGFRMILDWARALDES